jgi:AraC-like DNA-binding protein
VALDIENLSKESFLFLLNHIINELSIRNIYFSTKMSTPKNNTLLVVPKFSLDIVLSGEKHMIFPTKNGKQDIFMCPGDIHCCPMLCWKLPLWDSIHEMCGIVFYDKFIRLTYINSNNLNKSYVKGPDVFFHTSMPLSEAGTNLLKTLKLASDSTGNPEVKKYLMKALLLLVFENLNKNEMLKTAKAHRWLQVNDYLRNNFYYSINRDHVAHKFGLNPSYLSRLFTVNSGVSFTMTLRRLRMEYAALLLKNTDMTLVEITEQCGYLSYTYFSTAFKKYYSMSPGQFRDHNSN